MSDEFTPRELGLLAGGRWATAAVHEDLPELADILNTASVPESVRSRILSLGFDHRLDEFEDRAQAEVQFWEASRTDAARSSLNSRSPMP